jgi:hypothetical protein
MRYCGSTRPFCCSRPSGKWTMGIIMMTLRTQQRHRFSIAPESPRGTRKFVNCCVRVAFYTISR